MTTQDEAVIEAVARDLCIQDGCDPDGLIAYVKAPRTQAHATAVAEWNRYLDRARKSIRAYLSALDKAGFGGWTVVQKHAITMGQMDAGERALAGLDLTTATPEQIVQRVYFATVQASPPPPGADK